jgi:hypothetical protein
VRYFACRTRGEQGTGIGIGRKAWAGIPVLQAYLTDCVNGICMYVGGGLIVEGREVRDMFPMKR